MDKCFDYLFSSGPEGPEEPRQLSRSGSLRRRDRSMDRRWEQNLKELQKKNLWTEHELFQMFFIPTKL